MTPADGSATGRLEGAGVAPDIAVALTRESLLTGKDEILEAAIERVLEERPALESGR